MTNPTTSQERIESIDIVRGFALMGVFLINFQWMIIWDDVEGGANGVAIWFLDSIVAGKFYRLFAFLFGVGFALQMYRLEARGAPFVRIYLRRLAVLLVFGVAHGMLLWPNDILALFAQLGVLLLLIRKVSNRGLIVIGIACLFAVQANYYVSTGFSDFFPESTQVQEDTSQQPIENTTQDVERVRSVGSYSEVVAWTASRFLDWQTRWRTRLAILREEFLMFLLGLYAGRRRLFERPRENVGFIKSATLATAAVGISAYPAISWLTELAAHPTNGHLAITFRQALIAVQAAALSLFYGLALFRMVERYRLHQLLAPVANLGRLALTNYLLLSILVTMAFYDYGFGLYGRVTVLGGIAMAVVAYFFLAAASSWWLRRFRFGPTEWVWRSLTYGVLQPMRIG